MEKDTINCKPMSVLSFLSKGIEKFSAYKA